MGLTRRLFSKGAVAAPAVGPAMVTEFIEKAAGAQQFVGAAGRFSNAAQASALNNILSQPSGGSFLDSLKSELANLLGIDRSTLLGEAMRQVIRFDADLTANKSLSLSARVRIQAERNIEREFEYRKKSLSQQIAHYAERMGS